MAQEIERDGSVAGAMMPNHEPQSESTRALGAGASAQREFERRRGKREHTTRTRYPKTGGLILALTDEPQSTTAWAKGAEGERRLGRGLDELTSGGVIALHDRRIPGTRANIDHLVVAPTGVWVIDAKRYSGRVSKRDVGGWLRSDVRLSVGRRDCTKLVTGMRTQVDAVRGALGPDWSDVPVRPVLAFIDAEWGLFSKPFELGGVLVTWPKALRAILLRDGPYTPEEIGVLAALLDAGLQPA